MAPLVEQPVAPPPDVDHETAVPGGLQLPPQARGVRVQRPRSAERPEAPDLAQQFLLREHTLRVGHQLDEQLVLLAGESGRSAVDRDAPRCPVELDRPGLDDGVRGRRRPSQDGADPGEQLLVLERPSQEVVAAAFERPDAVDRIRVRIAEDDDRDVAEPTAAFVERRRSAEQDEIGPGVVVDETEAVTRQVPDERRLGLEDEECIRHRIDASSVLRTRLDVLSLEIVTNDLQPAGADYAPKEPDPQDPREREPEHGDDVDPEQVRARLGEDPDQARSDQAAGDNHRDHEPVEDDVDLGHQIVEPLVDEADLDLAVPNLLERVVDLVRELERDLAEADRLLPRAGGHAPRPEPLEHQAPRVRPRDLEDVEVRVQPDTHRAERRDRAVEEQEPSRQPQIHRVDQLERLTDHLQRVDLGEARAVVPVVELLQFDAELLLPLFRIPDT